MQKSIPKVAPNTWISIGQSIDGYVFAVNVDGSLQVGYFQHRLKAIKESVVWNGEQWIFKNTGPNGSYLRGADEAIVKRGP